MPVDRVISIQPGRGGVNLRDHASELREGELTDSLNWRIDQRGQLEKRLGYSPLGSPGAPILELALYEPSGVVPKIVAYCTDGNVYSSPDGAVWTQIATGLSTTARPSFAQYLDKLYWANGVDDLQQWDGSTLTAITTAPKGKYLTVWRNRLWMAGNPLQPRRVYWSKLADPADWTFLLNFVDFPNGPIITALATAPNVSATSDGADGVLVFTERSMSRVYDDTDNTAGAVVGGANVLVDAALGCASNRSIAQDRGRLYLLGIDGVYSTDGHSQLRVESKLIESLFHGATVISDAAVGVAYRGRYLVAVTTTDSAHNDRLCELYLDLPPNEQGQYPWMFHDVPAASFVQYPATTQNLLYFADASTSNTPYLRWLFNGGSDTTDVDTAMDVTARFTSGASQYGTSAPKLLVRAFTMGRGVLGVGVAADFERAQGEVQTIRIERTGTKWGQFVWGNAKWGGDAGPPGRPAYYSKRGRWLHWNVSETSQNVGPPRTSLGVSASQTGGAEVSVIQATIRPLDLP